MENKIKWFSDENSQGFIEYKGNDVFIHYSSKDGECIELELIKTDNGYEMKNKDRN